MKAIRTPKAIEIRDLCKSYQAGGQRFAVLERISLAIEGGEFVCLLGPSGGGKSTLLNILAGLEYPDSGSIVFPRGEARPRERGTPPAMAYMQQKDLLLPWRNLWDNVLLAPELRSAAEKKAMADMARELLRKYGLEGFQRAYPSQLSGGMRQRAALIRTLLCRPEILLMDEPFGALDAITRRKLQRELVRVWREYGLTVLFVTHDVEEALEVSQRIVVLSSRPGRVLEEIPVNLPPSKRSKAPALLQLKTRILDLLEGGDAQL